MLEKISGELYDRVRIFLPDNNRGIILWVFRGMRAEITTQADTMGMPDFPLKVAALV
jgi:hypothetical protein